MGITNSNKELNKDRIDCGGTFQVTLSLTADAREDGLIKARTGSDTVDKTYQDWYKNVYVPEVTAEAQG